jgi:hypothetical protein
LFAAASFPIRCKRWNPPIDLRFANADLRFEEWQKNEMMLPAVLDSWAVHALQQADCSLYHLRVAYFGYEQRHIDRQI